jgi:hypothetical protein
MQRPDGNAAAIEILCDGHIVSLRQLIDTATALFARHFLLPTG